MPRKFSKNYCRFCSAETYPDEDKTCCQDCWGELQKIKRNRKQINKLESKSKSLSRTEMLGLGFVNSVQGE